MKTNRKSRKGSGGWTALLGTLMLLAVGAWFEQSVTFQPIREALQARYAHRSSFPGNRTVRLLSRMGVLHSESTKQVPESARLVTQGPNSSRKTIAFWGVGPSDPQVLPSTKLVPTELRDSGAPILSIYLDKRDRRSLLNRPHARGRAAERSAYVSYFDSGRLVFGSGAGIRPHGGRSRSDPNAKSFRLYLRGTYGAEKFPPRLIADEQIDPLQRIVVRIDQSLDNFGVEWHLVSPMAYDIARQAGALTPMTKPVVLVINGKSRGPYVLTEYLDDKYVEATYGHGQFTLVRSKLDRRTTRFQSGDLASYRAFLAFVRSANEHTLSEINSQVDLDNLSRWFLSMIICGTTDYFQGPLIHDDFKTDAKWFWINWDMDNSFMSAGKRSRERPWEVDIYDEIVTRFHRDPRSQLLRTLTTRHPGYRRQLLETYTEIMNHRVTREFVAGRLDHYDEVGRLLGISDLRSIERIRLYLELREPIVRNRLGSRLGGGAAIEVSVKVPDGRSLEIDGSPMTSDYRGWYYETLPIEVEIPEHDLADFSHWLVNGQEVREVSIRPDGTDDLTIRPIFHNKT